MAALVGIGPLAHGGVGGAIVEASAVILIVAIALAVWVANRRDGERGEPD